MHLKTSAALALVSVFSHHLKYITTACFCPSLQEKLQDFRDIHYIFAADSTLFNGILPCFAVPETIFNAFDEERFESLFIIPRLTVICCNFF